MSYDFTTLSPDDFEALVADLLSREFGSQLELFKVGRDQGIDLRNSRVLNQQPRAIVQCKRYAPYRFGALLASMKKELPKLEKLKPQRYIVATSVELSPANKDELVVSLTPWCRGPEDIYGAAEINALLRKHEGVERAHFKLWISSTAVLERLVQSRIFNLTDDTVESAKEQMARLVVHDGFRRALDALAEHRHVLIVGNPGIGKTTLARMLMCHYLQDGFEPIVVSGDIGDAWAAIRVSKESDRRIVVLYDDFLGQLKFDSLRFNKNEEMSLHAFLDRVRRSNSLRFILTTREYILADARRVHGAFEKDANEMMRCTVSLDDYSKAHRAKVLFNHLYFSALPESRLKKLVEQRVYQRIIAHRHFSPRIVEGISNYANSRALSDEEYVAYIDREFNDPRAVWEHPFRHQISPTARQLLLLLWSFGSPAELGDLKASFIRLNSSRPPEEASLEWHDAMRELDGNFISTNRFSFKSDPSRWVTLVDFQNPSVKEFVQGFVESDAACLERLAAAVVSFAQVEHLMRFGGRSSDAFWSRLDEGARRSESRKAGTLGYVSDPEGLVWRQWEEAWPNGLDRMVCRLEILERVPDGASSRSELLQRVLSAEGWQILTARVRADKEIASGVKELMQWLGEQRTTVAESERDAVLRAFRSFLYESLLSAGDSTWSIPVTSLLELASALVIFDKHLDADERDAFVQAAIQAADEACRTFDDADKLEAEAQAISKLGQLFKINLEETSDRLLEAAEEARQNEPSEYERDDDRRPYTSDRDDALDVDALFAGLLDR